MQRIVCQILSINLFRRAKYVRHILFWLRKSTWLADSTYTEVTKYEVLIPYRSRDIIILCEKCPIYVRLLY